MDIALSPKTKLFIFVLFIGFVLSFLFYLMDIPIGWGGRISVLVIAFILYALLARIAEKLGQKKDF